MAMNDAPIISLESVSKTYATGEEVIQALADVTLEIGSTEFLSLVGPSGSGKSTLLNIIGGIDAPTSGRVYVDGERVDGQKEARLLELRRRKIAYVFQEPRLLPSLNALENVMLPSAFSANGVSDATARARELLARVGLGKRSKHMPHELSGGEAQRVAVARALFNHPKLILADEPTGNLDYHTRIEMMDLFESLNGDGLTILMVTHDDELAARARRRLALHNGRIERDERRGA